LTQRLHSLHFQQACAEHILEITKKLIKTLKINLFDKKFTYIIACNKQESIVHAEAIKKPQTLLFEASSGGNGGIRTLDEALHPILP
jgi:ABC-type arginine transport system ATPase subunit